MKSFVIVAMVAVGLLVGGTWWSRSISSTSPDDSSVISRTGLHWHPQLEVYIKGEKQEIPANVGVGTSYAALPTYDATMRMTGIHTHDDMPIIHLEFDGIVAQEDILLGNFFRIWGKEFSASQLFDHHTGPDGKVLLFVNGTENMEFENYQMRDGDRIEVRYE